MYLKRIEIRGFKSFADQTQIEFEEGVTGIVGPNGSGKSNISDAIRWVLGEQSAKTLRGSRMDDVIFAGTMNRKPMGMGEVSLVLDNQSQNLPVDYAEVIITRRVYRSGESEYSINKTPCRLKDIREIFMDTGLGVDGYSIIGQGRIDEILSSKTNNRRILLEEAAGIIKYRSRKEEAEKKLENTKQNLLRIEDIIKELESRIKPLKNQCEKAKKYLNLSQELKDIQINWFVHEIETLTYDIKGLKQQEQVIIDQLKQHVEGKEKIENKYVKLKEDIQNIEGLMTQLQNNIFEAAHSMEKKEGELDLCEEKLHHNLQNIQRMEQEIQEKSTSKAEFSQNHTKLEESFRQIEQFLDKIQENLKEKEDKFYDISNQLKQKEETMEESKGNIIEILNQGAAKKSQMQGLMTLQKNMQKRYEQIHGENQKFLDAKSELDKEQIKVNKDINHVQDEVENLHHQKDETENALQKIQKDIKKSQENLQHIKENMQQKNTRKTLLEEMEKEYEGIYKSVKNTLIHARKDKKLGKGVLGIIAEIIKVPKDFEVAIEVALGNSMQNIICDETQDANRLIQFLKKNRLGRVTFLPLDRFNKKNYSKNNAIEDIKGVRGYAMDQIEFEEKYRPIMNHLLGRVVIVDTIDIGIAFSKNTKNQYKIVSLDGDIINPSGAITGGSYQSKSRNLLSRKREISELHEEINKLKKEYHQKDENIKSLEKTSSDIHMNAQNIQEIIKQKEIQLINAYNQRKQLEKDLKNMDQQVNRIEMEMNQLQGDEEDTKKKIDILEEKIDELKKQEQKINDFVASYKNTYEDDKTQKEELQKQVTDLKVEIASLNQKKMNIEENLKINLDKIKGLDNEKIIQQNKILDLKKNQEDLSKQIKILHIKIKDADVLKKQCAFNLEKEKENKEKICTEYETYEAQFQKMNSIISDLQDSRHKIDIKLAKLEMQQQGYHNKMWEQYEITYQQALKYKKEDINMYESSKATKVLKQEIKKLGSVNIDAIKEYEEVMQRYEFMSTQKNDLLEGTKSLKKVIKDMEHTMKEEFSICFEKIQKYFNEIFQKLFGGGKAKLNLEDEDDLLTSTIEITAQPPGKKLQNINLLSGGEKALTAIALLFAILKVKPTPFCILDEIEAALDDANVYRYADFLKEFSKQTQFIVVTHRKGTMESADALYGVTMQEHGVSKLISVKLKEQAS